MIEREIAPAVLSMAEKMPIIVITGPRQSGKTTLVKALFPDYEYVNLEYPDVRARVAEDPRFFLSKSDRGVVLDEVQRLPELFSYIQGMADEIGKPGRFILTGSNNFLLMERISQSLAGRAAIFHLFPLTISEIGSVYSVADDFTQLAFMGTYPRIYDQHLQPDEWYPSYIASYLERDVRLIENIRDLHKFQLFLRICAGRVGQLFNASAIANDIGVNYKTIQSWVSILEASFIIFLLQPFYNNFNKRLTKSPKLYFYDTGLVCSLLGIRSAEELNFHYLKGEIFESLMISEIQKHIANRHLSAKLYFWRDNAGHEIDCLVDTGLDVYAIELKSSTTIIPDFFKNLKYWQGMTRSSTENSFVVFAGLENQIWPNGQSVGWKSVSEILAKFS